MNEWWPAPPGTQRNASHGSTTPKPGAAALFQLSNDDGWSAMQLTSFEHKQTGAGNPAAECMDNMQDANQHLPVDVKGNYASYINMVHTCSRAARWLPFLHPHQQAGPPGANPAARN